MIKVVGIVFFGFIGFLLMLMTGLSVYGPPNGFNSKTTIVMLSIFLILDVLIIGLIANS